MSLLVQAVLVLFLVLVALLTAILLLLIVLRLPVVDLVEREGLAVA
jgi:hypothetical protein